MSADPTSRAGATALIALGAAVVAYFQLRQARHLREDQARPFVVVDIVPSQVDTHILNFVIENVGSTLAQDIRIAFDPPIASSLPGYDLAGSALLRDGIPTMPPRRRIELLFDISHQRLCTDLPRRYDVTVSYGNARGRAESRRGQAAATRRRAPALEPVACGAQAAHRRSSAWW